MRQVYLLILRSSPNHSLIHAVGMECVLEEKVNSCVEELYWNPSFIICQLKLGVSLTMCSYEVYDCFLGY